jgi:hypothetical protein
MAFSGIIPSINVDSSNVHFKSVSGVLFNISGTRLIQMGGSFNSINYIIPDGVITISAGAFMGCQWLTSIIIPNSVTTIGKEAFTYCLRLSNIDIPDNVTSIGERTFVGCSLLTNVTLPNSITTIGEKMFENCNKLSNIVIPASVTKIEYDAFFLCSQLQTVYINAENPPELVTPVFSLCNNLTAIKVPSAKVDDYKYADGWSNYSGLIVPQ